MSLVSSTLNKYLNVFLDFFVLSFSLNLTNKKFDPVFLYFIRPLTGHINRDSVADL